MTDSLFRQNRGYPDCSRSSVLKEALTNLPVVLTLYPDTEWNGILRAAYSLGYRKDARRSFLPPHSPHSAVFPVSPLRFWIPSRMKRLSEPAAHAPCVRVRRIRACRRSAGRPSGTRRTPSPPGSGSHQKGTGPEHWPHHRAPAMINAAGGGPARMKKPVRSDPYRLDPLHSNSSCAQASAAQAWPVAA